jgi:hypothetical protein
VPGKPNGVFGLACQLGHGRPRSAQESLNLTLQEARVATKLGYFRHRVNTMPLLARIVKLSGIRDGIGSLGWIRTSNPPVDSKMQVFGLVGSSCL